MKKIIFSILVLFFISLVSAGQLSVQKPEKIPVVISELNNPAVYDLTIQNNGGQDNFQIYSLVGVAFTPRDRFVLPFGNTSMQFSAQPNEKLRQKTGFINFEYQIKGEKSGIFKDQLLMKIASLSDAIEISAAPVLPSDKTINVSVRNKEDTQITNLKIDFDSVFFSGEEYVSLNQYEEKQLTVPISKDISKLLAGPYIMKSNVQLSNGEKVRFESIIDFLEMQGTSVEEKQEGFVIHTTTIKKKNKGNTPVTAEISLDKDAISRLFTINSPSPDSTERKGLSVRYNWEKNIAPGEYLEINSTTNYTIPLIILILIVAAGVLAKIYSQTAVVLNKKVSFVKTKSGELALKVNIRVKARKHVDRLQIVDALPGMTKLYEKYGKLPDKIDHGSRRLYWNIQTLNAGEERVFSYILYSPLKIVGRLELPAATAVFEHDGKTKEAWSNRTFFVTGQTV